jgi:hypothetical protein
MQFEANLQDHEPVVVTGVKGMKSAHFRLRFRSLTAFARWAESEKAGDYTVHTVERSYERR